MVQYYFLPDRGLHNGIRSPASSVRDTKYHRSECGGPGYSDVDTHHGR